MIVTPCSWCHLECCVPSGITFAGWRIRCTLLSIKLSAHDDVIFNTKCGSTMTTQIAVTVVKKMYFTFQEKSIHTEVTLTLNIGTHYFVFQEVITLTYCSKIVWGYIGTVPYHIQHKKPHNDLDSGKTKHTCQAHMLISQKEVTASTVCSNHTQTI